MEKEIFSYCFSKKSQTEKWFYQVPQHLSNSPSHCVVGRQRALRSQQREIETFLVSNKRHLKVDRDIQFCCPLVQ